jgi:hypothetical protein
MFERSFTDGIVGYTDPPWPWIHSNDISKVSEYVHVNGDPVGSTQVGPSEIDPKFNQSYQDRIIHCIENNYSYLREVDSEWKESFNHWSTFGHTWDYDHDSGCVNIEDYKQTYRGTWWYPIIYSKGDIVYHNLYWYRCIQAHTSTVGTAPDLSGGEDYWRKPRHQPDWISGDPIYVQFASLLFNCNSSAYEKVLKDVGEYDWWWCDRSVGEFPAVPWWLYQQHYLGMTIHQADPDAGHNLTTMKRYPLSSGCWRKVWRYTMSWNHDRDEGQKARLGKIIDIDGEKVSMMWPGELGLPPGYDEIEAYYGWFGGFFYDYRFSATVITREIYDNMEAAFKQYFIPQDALPISGNSVEDLFRVAYRAQKNSIESRLKERHDPLDTEWLLDEATGDWFEMPIWEMKPELINDLKAALEKLRFLGHTKEKEVAQLYWYTNLQNYGSGQAAYTAGKGVELYVEYVLNQFEVGIRGFVCYYTESWLTYSPWDVTLPANSCSISKARITIISDDMLIPSSFVGAAMVRVSYRTSLAGAGGVREDMPVGFKGLVLEDSRVPVGSQELEWKSAFVALSGQDFNWVYNTSESKWEYKCQFETELLEGWPPDGYFGGSYTDAEWREWYKKLDFIWNIDNQCIFLIDFDGFDSEVFTQDPTNAIEVT